VLDLRPEVVMDLEGDVHVEYRSRENDEVVVVGNRSTK
jgi:hypothetical protein